MFLAILSVRDNLKWLWLAFTRPLYASTSDKTYDLLTRLSLNGVAWADKKKSKSTRNVSARKVGSRFEKKKRNKKRRFKQASPNKSPFFFHSPNAVMNIFCLRTCGQPENKVTETEKGAKIAPIVLPSTARFICFNRPKNKNASLTIV